VATPIIIVFEKQPRWVPELQWQFVDHDVRVRACCSTRDIEQHFNSTLKCVVVLAMSAGAAECLQFLGLCEGRWFFPPVIVIGSKQTAELEWPLRELGAFAFVEDRIGGEELARICRSQFRATLGG